MKLRDPKTPMLIANRLTSDIELVSKNSMLSHEICMSLVNLARNAISSLVTQVIEGTISVNEWHAMVMDVKDIICTMLQEGKHD